MCSTSQPIHSGLHGYNAQQSSAAIHTKANAQPCHTYQQLKNKQLTQFNHLNDSQLQFSQKMFGSLFLVGWGMGVGGGGLNIQWTWTQRWGSYITSMWMVIIVFHPTKTFDSNKAKTAGHIWVSQSYYAVTEREATLGSDMLNRKSGVFQGDPGKDCFQPPSWCTGHSLPVLRAM